MKGFVFVPLAALVLAACQDQAQPDAPFAPTVRVAGERACVTPPSEMVGWWPLDETSGTTAADIVGGNDGTHVGGPVPVAGKVDGGLSFDGVDARVVINSTFPFHEQGDATLDFWLNAPGNAHQAVFWTRPDDPACTRSRYCGRPGR